MQFLCIDADWWSSDEELRARLGIVVEELAHGEAQRLSGIPLLLYARSKAPSAATASAVGCSSLQSPTAASTWRSPRPAAPPPAGRRDARDPRLLQPLRATRTQPRPPRASRTTLVLDNPIGKASADFLIEKQRAVASALRVQLISPPTSTTSAHSTTSRS
jgi:hypothetical protein